MGEMRFIIKITPVDIAEWPCECFYNGISYSCGSNLYPSETKENMFKCAYKTLKGAEIGYKRYIGKYFGRPAIESCAWWDRVRLLPKKDRDRLLLKEYEKIKDRYNAEIMTVDEAWDDWTKVFNKLYSHWNC